MIEFILKYWIQALFGIILSAVSIIYNRLVKKIRENYKKTVVTQDGVQALLRNSIVAVYNRYSEKKYMPIYEKENLTHLITEYQSLGGNGVVTKLYEELMNLPVKSPNGKEGIK